MEACNINKDFYSNGVGIRRSGQAPQARNPTTITALHHTFFSGVGAAG